MSDTLRIGVLRLTDAAPALVAHELGFFADEGVETEIAVEPSWANIADKLAYGFLEAAVIVPPLAFAITLGLRGRAQPLIVPFNMSLGGNTITFATGLAADVRERSTRDNVSIATAFSAAVRDRTAPPVLAVVHIYSTHNLLLRYWLATAGIECGRDVVLSVVPPAQAVEALKSGRIAGFCAGAPWGEMAVREKLGRTVATSHDIWRNAPEKAFALRAQWVNDNPAKLAAALRALLKAARFCDAPENASYIAALLSRRRYIGVDSHAILSSLPGGAQEQRNLTFFHRHTATFPWLSHAEWFLAQMKRWDLVDRNIDIQAAANDLYRPDVYRSVAAGVGETVPVADLKAEGAHKEPWLLEAVPASIAMDPDAFCDGAIFEPKR